MGGLSDARPANQFAPLTPEQEAMLRRQAVQETVSPLDLVTGGLIGGVLPGGLVAPFTGAATAMLGRGYLPGALAGHGIGAGMGMYAANKNLPEIRHQKNMLMDAEGQPGGFYGEMPPRYQGDAEGQPGGFYGQMPRR